MACWFVCVCWLCVNNGLLGKQNSFVLRAKWCNIHIGWTKCSVCICTVSFLARLFVSFELVVCCAPKKQVTFESLPRACVCAHGLRMNGNRFDKNFSLMINFWFYQFIMIIMIMVISLWLKRKKQVLLLKHTQYSRWRKRKKRVENKSKR